MLQLLVTLTPIALIDCLGPGRFITLSILLGTKRPVAMSIAYLSGVFLGYFAFGSLVLFGLDKVLEKLGQKMGVIWDKPIAPEDVIIQLIVGILLLAFAWRAVQPKKKKEAAAEDLTEKKESARGFFGIFLFGAVPAFMPTPDMLPYLAALDQMLQANLNPAQKILTLLYYNIIFLITPSVLILIRVISKEKGERLFGAVTRFITTWGKGLLMVILMLLGALLIADAIGLIIGHPILPVPDSYYESGS